MWRRSNTILSTTRSWLQCKWEAYCENYLPYLLCARDKLLQKHL